MKLVCLDLEGVLLPEIWLALADHTGITGLQKTTRDVPDYDQLMRMRLEILTKHGIGMAELDEVCGQIEPLPGAVDFMHELQSRAPVVILSDTFTQFMRHPAGRLGYPPIFCNSLVVDDSGAIVDYSLRQKDGKRIAVESFQAMNLKVFAAGDSHNDLSMIHKAEAGCLFRAPQSIVDSHPQLAATVGYDELLAEIDGFLG